ncbi:hypothetical protein E1176_17020 [Fulvivirga sp. RKSG066]|uniref:hypothetical protein n=1 Tax=Fulvivirga aurantia TaxID=2529383 RepID=UPI0012BB49CD|nr:hypothetical protein [Fulvivirga aurantia]MTI22737.1 hypothetical protein [Fulvivirga aurantia]
MKYLILLSFIAFTACSSNTNEGEEKNEAKNDKPGRELVGEWRNLSMIVRMPDSTVNVPEGKWEEVLGIKPIITTYSEDGTFISEYRTLEDSVFMTSAGSWSVKGDTLTMVERGNANKYYFSIDEDTAIFRGYLDWNEDGAADDHYVGKQTKTKQ